MSSSPPRRDGFFKDGEDINDDFLPETGDRSLYDMPWLGRKGDDCYEEPSQARRIKIYNRKVYIRLDRSSTHSEGSSPETRCQACGTRIQCRCKCCSHTSGRKEPGRKKVGNRKDAGTRKQSLPKSFRRLESMFSAAIAVEAEKIGRQLAMATSMFAAGFALGSTGKVDDETEEEEEDEDEE